MKRITYERVVSGDTETPISLYAKYVDGQCGFLLESKELPRGRYSFMSANPHRMIKSYKGTIEVYTYDGQLNVMQQKRQLTGKVLDVVEEVMKEYDVVNTTDLPFIGGAVGTVGYDMIRDYEAIPDNNPDGIGTPDTHLLFADELVVYDHQHHRIHFVVLESDDEEGRGRSERRFDAMEALIEKPLRLSRLQQEPSITFETNMSEADYVKAVNQAKEYIYNGDIFQVVLSQRLSGSRKEIDGFNLYRKLRQVNPSPYMYYFQMGEYTIVGSSPEMLVSMKEDVIQNCPIAGTRPMGRSIEENDALAADLLSDEKEKAEHRMLVDLGRNDMGKVAQIGSVHVDKLMEVEQYSHVMHLVSLVSGKKKEGLSMYDVLMSFLPAGTLSGAPKIRAMEIIDELENVRRGIYGGAIGYFGYNNNMDMCIAIRTMVIKEDTVHIQAGAGIVADSDPIKEFEETMNKAKALVSAINKQEV